MTALTEWLRGKAGEEDVARGFETRAVSERELLLGSSFALTGGSAETGFGALWGRASVSGFDGRDGDLTVDGEVTSAMLGADWSRGRATAGLAVAHSRGEGSYRSPGGDGAAESALTGVYPYGRYALSERLSVWGVAGSGAGLADAQAGERGADRDRHGARDGVARSSRGPGGGSGRGRHGAGGEDGRDAGAHEHGCGARRGWRQHGGVGGGGDAAPAGAAGDVARGRGRRRGADADAGGGRAP